jgi:hypothetical protein
MFVFEVPVPFVSSSEARRADPFGLLDEFCQKFHPSSLGWQGGQLRAPVPGPRADFTLSRFRQEVRDTSFQCVIQSASEAVLEPEMSSSMTDMASRFASGPVACRQSNDPSQTLSESLCSGMQRELQGNAAVRIPRKRSLPPSAAMQPADRKPEFDSWRFGSENIENPIRVCRV